MSDNSQQVVAITCMSSFFMRAVDILPGQLLEAFNLQIDEERSVEVLALTAATLLSSSGKKVVLLVDVNGVGESLAVALQVRGFDVRRFNPAAPCDPAYEGAHFLNQQAKGGHMYNEGVRAGCITYVDGSTPPYVPLELHENGQWRINANSGEVRLSSMLGLYSQEYVQPCPLTNWLA